MSEQLVTRRKFLERCAVLGVAIGAGGLLAACGGEEEPAGGGETMNEGGGEALDCSDVSALSEAEVQTRTSLQYVEVSETADQNCLNCEQYTAGAAGECGTCTLVPGPINPEGWCLSWVEKVS